MPLIRYISANSSVNTCIQVKRVPCIYVLEVPFLSVIFIIPCRLVDNATPYIISLHHTKFRPNITPTSS